MACNKLISSLKINNQLQPVGHFLKNTEYFPSFLHIHPTNAVKMLRNNE